MTPRSLALAGLFVASACATGSGTDFADGDESSTSQGAGTTTGQGGAVGTGGGGATGGGTTGAGGGGCPDGYEQTGTECTDIDECALETDDCDPLVACVNEEPGFSCEACPAGYTDINGDGTQCDDVDECMAETDDCDPLAECINDVPGFHCGPCPSGTTDTNGDGTLCTPNNVIGLDDRHGYDADLALGTGTDHAQFRGVITGAGKTTTALSSLEANDLAGLGAVFVQQPYSQNSSLLSASEIAAIVAFVNGGGGLVVIGDGGGGGDQANLNLLAQNWGVTYSSSPQFGSGMAFTPIVHAVTTGVSSFGIDYGPPMTTVNAPAVALNNGSVVLAAVTGTAGAGNVVFVSDSMFNNSTTTDYNINSLDNATLLTNILSFVAN